MREKAAVVRSLALSTWPHATANFARRRSSIRRGSESVVRNAGGAWRSRFVEHVGSAPLRARARRPATPHLAGSSDRRRSGGGCLVVFTAPVIARDRNQSCSTILSSELLTLRPPLYSMSPSLRNLFMKKFTRERVAPIISASVSWEIFGNVRVGLSCPYGPTSSSLRASRFSLELNS